MSDEPLQLIGPTAELESEYLAMVHEFRDAGEPYHQRYYDDLRDFAGFVQKLRDQARGLGLPPGYVPGNTFWLVRGKRILGTSRLRHHLVPSLMNEGGHIGYDIRPSERGKGYATRLLALTLQKARERGITRVLVTCDTDNPASARVIHKNGGCFEDERVSEKSGKPVSRYWIDLAEAAPGHVPSAGAPPAGKG